MNNLQKHINFWRASAKRDFKTAKGLFTLKRYDSCLFFCHLSLEKLLKGLVVLKTKQPAPHIHDLKRLLDLSGISDFTEENINNLITITEFNISARYDNIKLAFYHKCTRKYTEKYFTISKKLYLWLEKKYPKN